MALRVTRILTGLGLPVLFLAVFTAPLSVAQADYRQATVLQALDKVTGRVHEIQTRIGEPAYFANLLIRSLKCFKAPPEDPPESAAFLEIVEQKQGEDPSTVFRGWMFASSPGLSAMEHPVYDVVVLDCAGDPVVDDSEPEAAETISPENPSNE